MKITKRGRWTTAVVATIATCIYATCWANDEKDSNSAAVLQRREKAFLAAANEISNLDSSTTDRTSMNDWEIAKDVYAYVYLGIKSSHNLNNLYLIYDLAPSSFKPFVRSVLAIEIDNEKKEVNTSIKTATKYLSLIKTAAPAIAVSHAKDCLEAYKGELDALNP